MQRMSDKLDKLVSNRSTELFRKSSEHHFIPQYTYFIHIPTN